MVTDGLQAQPCAGSPGRGLGVRKGVRCGHHPCDSAVRGGLEHRLQHCSLRQGQGVRHCGLGRGVAEQHQRWALKDGSAGDGGGRRGMLGERSMTAQEQGAGVQDGLESRAVHPQRARLFMRLVGARGG